MTNPDHTPEHDEAYLAEYRQMLQSYARLVVEHPESVEQVRAALQTSARLMISNRPEAIAHFNQLVQEIDAFLTACQTGEIEPKQFVANTMQTKK